MKKKFFILTLAALFAGAFVSKTQASSVEGHGGIVAVMVAIMDGDAAGDSKPAPEKAKPKDKPKKKSKKGALNNQSLKEEFEALNSSPETVELIQQSAGSASTK